jgi:transcription antitermination protein NusB
MVPIKKFREAVFYALFAFDMSEETSQNEDLFMQQLSMTKKNVRLAFLRANQIREKLEILDPVIKQYAYEYEFDRISKVEKNALRLGLYEILFDEDIPKPVAISEAVRIAKKFGSIEGRKFVNGILETASNHKFQLCEA